ncbi:hypothetical protein HYR99_08060 [Candidatus Poribacteria bacterium]|nr:hypothetical protein [Candidatus Poribacteria bacterium]
MTELFCLTLLSALYHAQAGDYPSVEVEETISRYVSPNNGAGPLWCYGAPLLARQGDNVYVSVMETGEDAPPLCNTRWQLFQRDAHGWKLQQQAEQFREREPCPIVGFAAGKLFLSINPSTQPPGTRYGPCDPHLIQFTTEAIQHPGSAIRPHWDEGSRFTDHSYRGIAADGPRGEILVLNIHSQTGTQFWSYRDASGAWSTHGQISFPIRSCYPQVALRNRSAHVLAIGDIVEPNPEWRPYKHEQTGRDWDYVFRRLFYTWTPNIAQTDFAAPIELENLDATGGYIRNLDLWIDPNGAGHILYLKQSVQSALLRDKFFPNILLTTSLEYCVITEGKIVSQSTLVKGGEGESSEIPGNGRFHATDDGRLFVIYYCHGKTEAGTPVSENRLLQILPSQENPQHTRIALTEPFHTFFTAAERGGSPPSQIIDLFGVGREASILRYARVKLVPRR